MDPRVRLATKDDAEDLGRLLDAFNREFDEPTPGPEFLARRVPGLMDEDAVFLVTAERAVGMAVLRFRPALWAEAPEAYLAELYVVPEERGQGLGRALLEGALELAREHGAAWIELGTEESDVAARALYEKLGFSNHDRGGDQMLFYEREL